MSPRQSILIGLLIETIRVHTTSLPYNINLGTILQLCTWVFRRTLNGAHDAVVKIPINKIVKKIVVKIPPRDVFFHVKKSPTNSPKKSTKGKLQQNHPLKIFLINRREYFTRKISTKTFPKV